MNSLTVASMNRKNKVFFFPREIMSLIYEFDPTHRPNMKQVLYEYMIRFHFPKWCMVLENLQWRINCEYCLNTKPYNRLELPYCSKSCCRLALDYVEELV
jgi:hypothetical protein